MASRELKVARFILGAMGWPILAASWLGSLSPRKLIEREKSSACVECNRQVLHLPVFYSQHLPSGKIRRRGLLDEREILVADILCTHGRRVA